MTTEQQAELADALRVLAQGQVNLQLLVQAQSESNRTHRDEVSVLRDQIARQNEQMSLQSEGLRKSLEAKGRRTLLDTRARQAQPVLRAGVGLGSLELQVCDMDCSPV